MFESVVQLHRCSSQGRDINHSFEVTKEQSVFARNEVGGLSLRELQHHTTWEFASSVSERGEKHRNYGIRVPSNEGNFKGINRCKAVSSGSY